MDAISLNRVLCFTVAPYYTGIKRSNGLLIVALHYRAQDFQPGHADRPATLQRYETP
jgi:hypothetical protein